MTNHRSRVEATSKDARKIYVHCTQCDLYSGDIIIIVVKLREITCIYTNEIK